MLLNRFSETLHFVILAYVLKYYWYFSYTDVPIQYQAVCHSLDLCICTFVSFKDLTHIISPSNLILCISPVLRIQDPTTKGGGKVSCLSFFVAINFTKLKIIFLAKVQGKVWANWQRIIVFLSKKWFSEIVGLGSGILKKPIPDPGVKKHQIPDPQHCILHYYFYRWEVGRKERQEWKT